jgi:cytochrome c
MQHVDPSGALQVIEKQAGASVVQPRGLRPWSALLVAGLVIVAIGYTAPAHADAALARAKNCMACHAVDKKLIGPSYKEVALKYANDKNAVPQLARKVREGGVGVWGQIPMPANPQVSAEEATKLVNWVLGQK